MESTITTKNMVSIPVAIARRYGLLPGWKLSWEPGEKEDVILLRVIPDRAQRARRLLGAGRAYSPQRNAVAELVAEREADG